ncbi:MAG: hypothetical protein MJ252_17895, partial [archaeon]|nr:hypothetical protein [archaeon]
MSRPNNFGSNPGYDNENQEDDFYEGNNIPQSQQFPQNPTNNQQTYSTTINQERIGNKTKTTVNIKEVLKGTKVRKLQDIARHLMSVNLSELGTDSKDTLKLLYLFQNALRILSKKQNELEAKTNNDIMIYRQLIERSYQLEETLQRNKIIIKENKIEKQNKEKFLFAYKALVDENSLEKNVANMVYDEANQGKGKYFCHICEGKYFHSEERLEFHMKKRHANIAGNKLGLNQDLNQSFEIYGAKIEEMKNHFETLIKDKETDKFKNRFMLEMEKDRIANDRKIQEMENRLRTMLEEFKAFVQASMKINIDQGKLLLEQQQKEKNEKIIVQENSGIKEIMNPLSLITQNLQKLNELIESQAANQRQYYNYIDSQNKENLTKKETQLIQKEYIQQSNIEDIKRKEEEDIMRQTNKENQGDNLGDKSGMVINQPSIKIGAEGENSALTKTLAEARAKKKKQSDVDEMTVTKKEVIREKIINENEVEDRKAKTLPKDLFPMHFDNIEESYYKTLSHKGKLEDFYHKFNARDNKFFEGAGATTDDYLYMLVPPFQQFPEEQINQKMQSSITENLRVTGFQFKGKDFEGAMDQESKIELLNEINRTIKNINKANEENDMAKVYYDGIHATLDLKLIEEEKKAIENRNFSDVRSYKSIGSRKSRGSKRAQDVISEMENKYN